jgi:hypothetical protein
VPCVRNILRENEAECIARIWGVCFLYLFANILLTFLPCVCFCSEYIYFYTVTLLLFVNIVACRLIYSHESVGVWISIPQTANGKSIVRAPVIYLVFSPFFLGFTTPWAQHNVNCGQTHSSTRLSSLRVFVCFSVLQQISSLIPWNRPRQFPKHFLNVHNCRPFITVDTCIRHSCRSRVYALLYISRNQPLHA